MSTDRLPKVSSRRYLDFLIGGVALAMVVYHLAYSQVYIWGQALHNNAHLAFSLILLCLFFIRESKTGFGRASAFFLLLLSFIATAYVVIAYDDLLLREWFNTPLDLAVGVIIIFVTLEVTRKAMGLVIPGLSLVCALYPFVGSHFPEPFRVVAYPIDVTISKLTVSLTDGIYGPALATSANYIFLFIVFGGMLQGTGATRFFLQVGRLVGTRFRGGPGLMAVVCSALVGMITGSAVANASIVGSFTIPLMKKVGYRAEAAGAIEAAASTGGQIMPPVMGAVAFLMSGMTGIPYVKICVMAIIPALLYYWGVGIYVQLRAMQWKVNPVVEKADTRELLLSAPLFVVPLVIIVVLLIRGNTVLYVSFWAIVSTFIIGLVRSAFTKEVPTFLRNVLQGTIDGAKSGAQVGGITGSVGLILTTFTMSGIGIKLASGITAWSGGNIFIAMLIVQAICTLMGMGGIAAPSYLIVAMFAVPAMRKVGISLEASHFFCTFPAVFAVITPPVAVAAVVTSRMAQAEYQKTALEACKLGFAGFVLPMMFVYAPVLLLFPSEPAAAVKDLSAAVLFFLAAEVGFVGYYLLACGWPERVLHLVVSTLLFVFIVMKGDPLFYAGFGLFGLLTLWQLRKRSLERTAQAFRENDRSVEEEGHDVS